jgi:CRP-like cAMP-binding protein
MAHPNGNGRLHYNRILSSLPAEDYERLAPHFHYVELPLRRVLYLPDDPMPFVYFPLSGTVSLTAPMRDGKEVEIGVVGREGVVGMPVFLGTDSAPFKAMVQVSGGAVRVKAGALREESGRCGELHRLLLRYAQAFFVQAAQTAACNRLHPMEGRLAKWLLTTRDRAGRVEMDLTQEFLGVMLGVRRAGVNEALGELERRGLVGHARARITILDGPGLEAFSCECYGVVKKEFDRLLGAEVTHGPWRGGAAPEVSRLY